MKRYAVYLGWRSRISELIHIESSFISQAVDEVVVDNDEQAAVPGDVIEEPEFQPEINQVDDDQIGEPPQPKANLKFSGRRQFMNKYCRYNKYIDQTVVAIQKIMTLGTFRAAK